MNPKPENSNLDNIKYKDVLEDLNQNQLNSQYFSGNEKSIKKNFLYRIKRTPLEIINRLLFFLFIGSFIYSFISVYFLNKLWFYLYITSAFSCIFYTPNRKALKELIAAWPNIEDLFRGRGLWKK